MDVNIENITGMKRNSPNSIKNEEPSEKQQQKQQKQNNLMEIEEFKSRKTPDLFEPSPKYSPKPFKLVISSSSAFVSYKKTN